MDYIQSTISRMSSNSFLLKGWNLTILAAVQTVDWQENYIKAITCILLNVTFWSLDAYYLRQEKLFRELYKEVSMIGNDNCINFSMDTQKFNDKVPSTCCIMWKTSSITPLYFLITLYMINTLVI